MQPIPVLRTVYDQPGYLSSHDISPASTTVSLLCSVSPSELLHKLINYSTEVLKTRLAKWLPINKTLWNQITLAIILLLSQSLKTGTVGISVAFASQQT